MLGPPNGVGPHVIGRADIGESRGPGLGSPEPHLSRVPNAVVEAVSDGNGLGEHALLDHPRHRSPGRSHPGFLALGSAGVDVAGRGHDVHFPMGARVELGPVVVVHRLPGAHRVGRRHDIGQAAGFGVPLAAKLVAHDAGHSRDSPRAAVRINVVIITGGVPKISLEVALAQRQPGIVSRG